MTTQQTPGPWYIGNLPMHETNLGYRYIITADGTIICNPSPMGEGNARLISAAPELRKSLEQALRYIEVLTAYKGAMTADEVEAAIVGKFAPSRVEVGANSCNTLAEFDFVEARAALAKASGL